MIPPAQASGFYSSIEDWTFFVQKDDNSRVNVIHRISGSVYTSESGHDISGVQYALSNLTSGRNHNEVITFMGEFTIAANVGLRPQDYTTMDCHNAKFTLGSGVVAHMIGIVPDVSGGTRQSVNILGGVFDGNRDNCISGGANILSVASDCMFKDFETKNANLHGIDIHRDVSLGWTSAENNIVSNVRAHHNCGIGIFYGSAASNGLIENCYTYNNSGSFVDNVGIFLDGIGFNNKIIDCWSYDNLEHGLLAAHQQNILIDGLHAYDNVENGMSLQSNVSASGVKDANITNSYFYGNGVNGIRVTSVNGLNISNCIIKNNVDTGIIAGVFGSGDIPSKAINITNCVAAENILNGIELRGLSGMQLNDCRLVGNTTYDNAFSGSATRGGLRVVNVKNFVVADNNSYDTQSPHRQSYGLLIDTSSAFGLIHGNSFHDTLSGAISWTQASGNTIKIYDSVLSGTVQELVKPTIQESLATSGNAFTISMPTESGRIFTWNNSTNSGQELINGTATSSPRPGGYFEARVSGTLVYLAYYLSG
jgi:hypothetical protein